MPDKGSVVLLVGAGLDALAGLAHLACIWLGAPAYRFMGAGGDFVRQAMDGRIRPALVTTLIAGVLFLWAAYALSGAGYIFRLPFTKAALIGISGVCLLRGVGYPLLRPFYPENSDTFWFVSSSITFALGMLHAEGLFLRWQAL